MLLDKYSPHANLYSLWFNNKIFSDDMAVDSEDEGQQTAEFSGKTKHFNFLRECFHDPAKLKLPPLNDKQLESVAEFIANLAMGSSAICYLRTQLRQVRLSEEVLTSAYNVASGFVTLFNKPESIAIVRLTTSSGSILTGSLSIQ